MVRNIVFVSIFWIALFPNISSAQTAEDEAAALNEWIRGYEQIQIQQSSALNFINQFNSLFRAWSQGVYSETRGDLVYDQLTLEMQGAHDRAFESFSNYPAPPEAHFFPQTQEASANLFAQYLVMERLFDELAEQMIIARQSIISGNNFNIRPLGLLQLRIGIEQMRSGQKLMQLQSHIAPETSLTLYHLRANIAEIDGILTANMIAVHAFQDTSFSITDQEITDIQTAATTVNNNIQIGSTRLEERREQLQVDQLLPGEAGRLAREELAKLSDFEVTFNNHQSIADVLAQWSRIFGQIESLDPFIAEFSSGMNEINPSLQENLRLEVSRDRRTTY